MAPRHPDSFWSMQGTAELFGARTLMPNAALATLMALTPDDVDIEYLLTDENTSEIDWELPCDLVAVTGATLHARRIREICGAFRQRGVPVALGGPWATVSEDLCDGLADHHFVGEAEHTWPRFLREWTAGRAAARYVQQEYVDLADSPPPDWSLIVPGHYLNINVQTSRGCPHGCDFCDVILYLGRRARTKTVDQIMTEVKNAHGLGTRSVFFSDDNFLGRPKFTRRLLEALVEWNSRQRRPLSFSTQITVSVADDEELLRLLADARFSVLFLGVETVRRASLEEVGKGHNLAHPLVERVQRISRYGIVPFLGLIVGFDADDRQVFGELRDFIEDTSSPIAGISLLNAPRHTPLYKRLQAEGRLVDGDFGGEWQLETNVIPKQLSREELFDGYWTLFRDIYEPEGFERRLGLWLAGVTYFTERYVNKRPDPAQMLQLVGILRHFLFQADGRIRRLFLRNVTRIWRTDPRLLKRFFTLMAQYRHFYDFVNRSGLPGAR